MLHICKELRDFCGFSKVPDAPLFHALSSVSRITLHSCSRGWWIIPTPSARRSTFPLPPCLLSILLASNFMSLKTIPKPSIPLSASSRLTIKTILMLTLIRWLTTLCLHKLLPVLTQNSSISMSISAMLVNSPSSLTVSALSAIPPFSMMLLRPPIQKFLWKEIRFPR